jgi:hypothetical protein
MTETEYLEPSVEEVQRMIFCGKTAVFTLWDTDRPKQVVERTDSGAPCGTELPPRNGVRGWEVCGDCLKNPALKTALILGAK